MLSCCCRSGCHNNIVILSCIRSFQKPPDVGLQLSQCKVCPVWGHTSTANSRRLDVTKRTSNKHLWGFTRSDKFILPVHHTRRTGSNTQTFSSNLFDYIWFAKFFPSNITVKSCHLPDLCIQKSSFEHNESINLNIFHHAKDVAIRKNNFKKAPKASKSRLLGKDVKQIRKHILLNEKVQQFD